MRVTVTDKTGIVYRCDSKHKKTAKLPDKEKYAEVENALRTAQKFLSGPEGDLTPEKLAESGFDVEYRNPKLVACIVAIATVLFTLVLAITTNVSFIVAAGWR